MKEKLRSGLNAGYENGLQGVVRLAVLQVIARITRRALLMLFFLYPDRTKLIDHDEHDQHHDREIQRPQLPPAAC